MYLTETRRLKTHWIHKIDNRQPLTWTTFRIERNQFLQLRVLGRILSGSWVGSYQHASGYYRSFSVSSYMQSHCQKLKFPFSSE